MGDILGVVSSLAAFLLKLRRDLETAKANEDEKTVLMQRIDTISAILPIIQNHPKRETAAGLKTAMEIVSERLKSAGKLLAEYQGSHSLRKVFKSKGIREDFKTIDSHLSSAVNDLQLIQTAILGDGMGHVCSGMDQILEMVTQLVLDKQEQAKHIYMGAGQAECQTASKTPEDFLRYNRRIMAFLMHQLEKMENFPKLSVRVGKEAHENGMSPLAMMESTVSLGYKLYNKHVKPFDLHTFYKVSEAKNAVEKICGSLRAFVEGCDLQGELCIECKIPDDEVVEDEREMEQHLGYIFEDQEWAFEDLPSCIEKEWRIVKTQHDDLLKHLRIVKDKDIELKEQICNKVYSAKWDNQDFAVKRLTGHGDSEILRLEEFAEFFAEVGALASMISVYVARLYAVTRSGKLVMELGECDLMTWYRKRPDCGSHAQFCSCEGWGLKLKLIHQAAMGLKHVHDQNFIHRDVQTRNFVVFMQGTHPVVKIVGFGLAMVKDESGTTRTVRKNLGAPTAWLALEVFNGKAQNIKSDIYSFGIVMYEVVGETWPYGRGTAPGKVLKRKRNGEPPCFVPQDCPAELLNLIESCCSNEPSERPDGMKDVVERLGGLTKKYSCSIHK